MNVFLKCSAAALLGTFVSVLLLSTLEMQTGRDSRGAHYERVLAELQMLRKETRLLKERLAAVEKRAERDDDQLLAGSSALSFGLAASSDQPQLIDPRNGIAEAPQAK